MEPVTITATTVEEFDALCSQMRKALTDHRDAGESFKIVYEKSDGGRVLVADLPKKPKPAAETEAETK